jgi:hypothetical protein
MRSKNDRADETPDMSLSFALAFAVSCIYAFALSLSAGVIMVASLQLGLSREAGLVAVLAFFCLEIALFFTERPTPGILLTSLFVLPCARIKDLELSKVPKAVRGQIIRMERGRSFYR